MKINLSVKSFSNFLYYVMFGAYVFFSLLSSYTVIGVQSEIITGLTRNVYLLCIIIAFTKIMLDRVYNIKSLAFLIFMGCISLIIFLKTSDSTIIVLVFLMMSANNCSPRTISKIHFVSASSVLLITLYSVFSGLVENAVSVRADGAVRHSLGMTLPPVFPMILAFVLIDYLYMKKKIKVFDIIIVMSVAVFSSFYFDARLENISLVGLAAILLFYKKAMNTKAVKYICIFSFVLCAAIAFSTVYLYMAFPDGLAPLNELLTNRLSLSADVIADQSYSLFGRVFRMQGWGTFYFDWSFGYYYIDSCYINYTLRFGIVFMIAFGCFITYMLSKVYKPENYLLVLFAAFSSIYGVIITSSLVSSVCPVYIMLFAKYREECAERLPLKRKAPGLARVNIRRKAYE